MIEHWTLRLNSELKMSPHELQFCVPEAGACDGLFVMSCPATARCHTAPHCIARGARPPFSRPCCAALSSEQPPSESWFLVGNCHNSWHTQLQAPGLWDRKLQDMSILSSSTGQKYQTRDPTGSKKDEGFEAKVKMKLKFFAIYPLSKIL